MAFKAGIIGLPNVGKSTLFNAITNSNIEVANYPFATIKPNVGVVELPDGRLEKIASIVKPEKIIFATFEFIDIAGLVKGASQGEGLGNKFLANIRETDVIVQVIRCFEDENINHIYGLVDPIRDLEIINLELLLADLETIESIIKRLEKKVKSSTNAKVQMEYSLVLTLKETLQNNSPIRSIKFNEEENKLLKGYQLLTNKPILYVGNVAEKHVVNPKESPIFKKLEEEVQKQGALIVGISAKMEYELSQLDNKNKNMFLADLGIKESGLDKITRVSFDLLNLATYFTAGVKEVRAWTFHKGYTAPQCAGIIHTDFQKGFIKAQIINYEDYIINNGDQGAKEAGKTSLEGKDYIMKDGDICYFRFNT